MSSKINHKNKIVLTEAFVKKANEFMGAEVFDPKTDIGKELMDKGENTNHSESYLSKEKDGIYGIRYNDDKLNNYERLIHSDGTVFGYYCRPFETSYGCTHEAKFPITKVDPKKMALFMVAVFGLDSMPTKVFNNIKDDPQAMIGAILLFEDVIKEDESLSEPKPTPISTTTKTETKEPNAITIQMSDTQQSDVKTFQKGETGKAIPMSKQR